MQFFCMLLFMDLWSDFSPKFSYLICIKNIKKNIKFLCPTHRTTTFVYWLRHFPRTNLPYAVEIVGCVDDAVLVQAGD